MTKTSFVSAPIVSSLLATALLGAASSAAAAASKEPRSQGRDMVVSCTSAVAWDIGPCTAQAFGRCKGRAQLLGALSSTYLAASKLHQISARYRCVGL